MVVMASGIARGRVRTESRNMAAMLQKEVDRDLKTWFTVYFFDATINWHLPNHGIRWPASRGHIAGSSLQRIKVTCPF